LFDLKMAAPQTGAYRRVLHFHPSCERQLMIGCEEMNNLIPQSGTKAQRLAKDNCFVFFAPSTTLSRLAG
jgi:hypothetical protein